jgi:hypothetical protein
LTHAKWLIADTASDREHTDSTGIKRGAAHQLLANGSHFYLFELGEYASIKTKCFLIRAEVRRFFNLIASRFITPVAGAWGGNTTKK